MLNDFIDQTIDGVIDQKIYDKFFDEIKGKEQTYIDKLIKKINLSETKYNIVKTSVAYFELLIERGKEWRGDAEVLSVISKIIFIGKNDTLQIILTRSLRYIKEVEEQGKELQLLTSSGKGTKADDDYFDFMVVQVGKFMGFHVDRSKVRLAEFAKMILSLRRENERVENKAKKDAVGRSNR